MRIMEPRVARGAQGVEQPAVGEAGQGMQPPQRLVMQCRAVNCVVAVGRAHCLLPTIKQETKLPKLRA